MKKAIFIFLYGSMAYASGPLDLQPGMACGNTDDAQGIWLNKYLIPDQFPFDAAYADYVTAGLLPDYQVAQKLCPKYAFAKWAPSCYEHDHCMEAIGMYGQTSTNCNDNVLAGWQSACQSAYDLTDDEYNFLYNSGWGSMGYMQSAVDKSYCATECMNMAQAAHDIMVKGTSSFGVAPKLILDVNGDGVKDAVLFPKTNRMYIDLGQKQNAFQFFPGHDVPASTSFKVGDFNGDGKGDLLQLASYVYWGNASGTFDVRDIQADTSQYVPPLTLQAGYTDVNNYYVRDFNHDGISDLMFYVSGRGYAYVWYGSRSGVFHLKKRIGNFTPDTYNDPVLAPVLSLLLN